MWENLYTSYACLYYISDGNRKCKKKGWKIPEKWKCCNWMGTGVRWREKWGKSKIDSFYFFWYSSLVLFGSYSHNLRFSSQSWPGSGTLFSYVERSIHVWVYCNSRHIQIHIKCDKIHRKGWSTVHNNTNKKKSIHRFMVFP